VAVTDGALRHGEDGAAQGNGCSPGKWEARRTRKLRRGGAEAARRGGNQARLGGMNDGEDDAVVARRWARLLLSPVSGLRLVLEASQRRARCRCWHSGGVDAGSGGDGRARQRRRRAGRRVGRHGRRQQLRLRFGEEEGRWQCPGSGNNSDGDLAGVAARPTTATLASAWTDGGGELNLAGDVAWVFAGAKLDAEEEWRRAAAFRQCGLSGAGGFYPRVDAASG
jgi:hypothetical protein